MTSGFHPHFKGDAIGHKGISIALNKDASQDLLSGATSPDEPFISEHSYGGPNSSCIWSWLDRCRCFDETIGIITRQGQSRRESA
ncbi:MAG: hypothetical protein DMG06_03140 [Acidobacteria bacterium]|nr:MAG: hypothetical protein DMG06_03140 [Acidobacteriota bacterium]